MPELDSPLLIIEFVAGEDLAVQMFWTSDYNEPMPVADPVLLDVKDANGQIAMRFAQTNDPRTAAWVAVDGNAGFFQLTAPASLTRKLVPGRYEFDLFAAVADSAAPFPAQLQQVVSGYFDVGRRVTHTETAAEADLTMNPLGD